MPPTAAGGQLRKDGEGFGCYFQQCPKAEQWGKREKVTAREREKLVCTTGFWTSPKPSSCQGSWAAQWCFGRAVVWQVGIAKRRETPALGENRKTQTQPCCSWECGKAWEEAACGTEKIKGISGETAVCSWVKFNQFPTVHVRFSPKMRQNLVSLPSRSHGGFLSFSVKKKKPKQTKTNEQTKRTPNLAMTWQSWLRIKNPMNKHPVAYPAFVLKAIELAPHPFLGSSLRSWETRACSINI